MQVIRKLRSRSQERCAPEDVSRTPKRLIRPLTSFRSRTATRSTSSVSNKARSPRRSGSDNIVVEQQAVAPTSRRLPCADLVPGTESVGGIDSSPLRQVNGFKAQPALATLQMEASNVAPFSLPQELLTYTPSSEAVTNHFRNGESERKIHCNIELSEEEQQKLKVMRDLVATQGKTFEPLLATAATRYLGRVRGDAKKAVREMAATQEWRKGYFKEGPVSDKSVEESLAHGMAYFIGRDRLMRPALVMRPARIPAAWYSDKRAATERLVRVLVFCIEYMMRFLLLPGRVEGGVIIMDMGGLSLSQVPFGPLKSILTIMANHYVNRIFKFYLLNLPSALNTTMQLGMRLLTQRQQQKLVLLRSPAELLQEFAAHQLEADLGGSRPVIEKFFPFPLQHGPFEVGSTNHTNGDAVPNLHEAFEAECIMGRIWDPAQSREVNVRLHFKEVARSILESCGASISPSQVEALAPSPRVEEALAGSASEAQDASAGEHAEAPATAVGVVAADVAMGHADAQDITVGHNGAVAEASMDLAALAKDGCSKADSGPVLLGGVDAAGGLNGIRPVKEMIGCGGGGNGVPRADAESTSAGSPEAMSGKEPKYMDPEQILLQDSVVQPAMFCSWLPLCGAAIAVSKDLEHAH